jgi:hypothetical protein
MSYEVFVCYKKSSGGNFAGEFKDAIFDIEKIRLFVAHKDLPNLVPYSTEWREIRDKAIRECRVFLMLVTYGFEKSPEVIEEIKLASKYEANKLFVVCRWKQRSHDISVELGDATLPLQRYTQIPFVNLDELVNPFLDSYHLQFDKNPKVAKERADESHLETIKSNEAELKPSPTPLVNYHITQSLLNTNLKRPLPDVGFSIRNLNQYPLRALIKARVILGGKDLGLVKGSMRMGKYLGYYDGKTTWNLNPYQIVFGHFSIPEEWLEKLNEGLTIEVKVSLEDLSGHRFEYLPVCWTYDIGTKDWFYEPTGDC